MEGGSKRQDAAEFKGEESEPWVQECELPLESGKGKEKDSPLQTPKGTPLCQHFNFHPTRSLGSLTHRTVGEKFVLSHEVCGNLL